MAGHNKWSQIKHKKAKNDSKKGKIFTKIIKEITLAARSGGGDPALNAKLRHFLEKGQEVNMPIENAKRAILRGTGELPGVDYQELRYEGYGPGGIAIVVETLSDNRNRTASEMRTLFAKNGGNLGEEGSVLWMFDNLGVIRVSGAHLSEDMLLDTLINFDIHDITSDENIFTVSCDPKSLDAVKKALQEARCTIESAELELVAKNPTELDDAQSQKALDFLSIVQDHDDVQNVYTNLA